MLATCVGWPSSNLIILSYCEENSWVMDTISLRWESESLISCTCSIFINVRNSGLSIALVLCSCARHCAWHKQCLRIELWHTHTHTKQPWHISPSVVETIDSLLLQAPFLLYLDLLRETSSTGLNWTQKSEKNIYYKVLMKGKTEMPASSSLWGLLKIYSSKNENVNNS